MRVFLHLTFILTAVMASSAQILPFVPCNAGKATTVGHADGITFQRVTFKESYGEVAASVFIPDSENPLPGIIFSHSAIQGLNHRTNLLRFALALARAGAASIVLDGTIQWQTPNDESKRAAHVLACAGQWMMLNFKMDRHLRAFAGTTLNWGGGDTPLCLEGERPCWTPDQGWLGFGQASPAEQGNTNAMLTRNGQLNLARFLQKQLKLGKLKSEWFAVEPVK